MITQGLKWMLDSSSPFYIKPRFDLEFFRWAWQFKKSATKAKVKKAIPVLTGINLKSRDLYDEMIASEDFEFHYEKKGLLLAYKTAKNEEHELKLAERAEELGLEAVPISRKRLQEIQPAFNESVVGAVHWTCDAHTTPHQFMENLKKWLEGKGVSIRANQKIMGFEKTAQRVTFRSLPTGRKENGNGDSQSGRICPGNRDLDTDFGKIAWPAHPDTGR